MSWSIVTRSHVPRQVSTDALLATPGRLGGAGARPPMRTTSSGALLPSISGAAAAPFRRTTHAAANANASLKAACVRSAAEARAARSARVDPAPAASPPRPRRPALLEQGESDDESLVTPLVLPHGLHVAY